MNIWSLPLGQQLQELNRLRNIAEILTRNGLSALVEQTELGRFLPRRWRRRSPQDEEVEKLSLAERVRRTLEDLGPTYIKLGQLLSGRGDLLPPGFTEELTKLLDSAPAFPYEKAAAQIEHELGGPPEAIFASFEREPIAAASIGQVHRATLLSGERVVVKVQRPHIEQTVKSDLDVLMRQAQFWERHSEIARSYNVSEIVEELGYALRNEMDYTSEAQNIDRFYQAYTDHPTIRIPKVYWQYTTRRVIVMEELVGIKLTDLDRLRREKYDLPAIAHVGTDFYLKQVFEDGFFHADPHPANLMVVDDKLAVLDFGMVAFVSHRLRDQLGDLLVSIISQEAERATTVLVRMGVVTRATNLRELERDLQRMMGRYLGLPLHQMDVAQILSEIFGIAFMHHIRLPSDFAMLIRTMLILNGVGNQLDPDYRLVQALEPFVRELVSKKLSIQRLGSNALRTMDSLGLMLQRFPTRLDDLWDQLDEGELTVGVSVRDLKMIIQRVDRIANRIAFSLIVAALIVGSALILMGGADIMALFKIPGLDIAIPVAQVSFILAGLTGAWLLWSIIRTKGM